MAASTLPHPGTQLGPCLSPCEHRDCAATWKMAAAACALCGKTIGYETRFYNDSDRGLVHAICLESEHEGTKR